ncbi:YggS family pyridoxal phosphate-dependent enzyme [Orbus mooreae]
MTIETNLQHIHYEITEICRECERDPSNIKLIAVSKTKPCFLIEQAIDAGQTIFGENYVQEGVEKIKYFAAHRPDTHLEWHFIGPLQSNKTRLVTEHFDWVHTVDRIKIAQRLNDQRPTFLNKLNVLIQINISNELTKSGITPEQLPQLAAQMSNLPNLVLRGLMFIPKAENEFKKQRETFLKAYDLYSELQQKIAGIDTLSMGMSGDMNAAIASGSNTIRIGSAIFGAREYN